jgi:hypothetical protein
MTGSLRLGVEPSGGTGAGKQQISSSRIGPFANNSSVRLEAAQYIGDVEIRANKVVLSGAGPRATEIAGDLAVHGNVCTIRSLSVTGNVYLYGNNNTLRNVRIGGKVISRGNNNSW